MSRSLALYSIAIASGVSVIGRLLAAFVAQKTGVMIPWIVCVVLSAIMCLAWIGIETQQSFLAFAALYGNSPPCFGHHVSCTPGQTVMDCF